MLIENLSVLTASSRKRRQSESYAIFGAPGVSQTKITTPYNKDNFGMRV